MTNSFPFLTIEIMNSGWVRMKDGNAAATPFLQANRRHMDLVEFGGRTPDLSIKYDRVVAFASHANKSGIRIFWDHNKAEVAA